MSAELRVAYLQKAPSGHMDACLRALADSGAEVMATMPAPTSAAPFAASNFDWIPRQVPVDGSTDWSALLTELEHFDPHVTLIVSWDVAAYRRCARALRDRTVRVLCMDNQWLRTPKQLLGVATRSVYVQRCFDRAFLPGERQAAFARKLGFRDEQIDTGFYSADVELFTGAPTLGDPGQRRAFLFVGRLVDAKGVDVLTAAYREYRRSVDDPWELLVAGSGEMPTALATADGVRALGFVQPGELPTVFDRASALVLPSRFEPWGVVVHEAACAGLLVVASDRVGAADDLVQHGGNGYIHPSADVGRLVEGMRWAHALTTEQRRAASELSRRLSTRFSPVQWSTTVRSMAQGRP